MEEKPKIETHEDRVEWLAREMCLGRCDDLVFDVTHKTIARMENGCLWLPASETAVPRWKLYKQDAENILKLAHLAGVKFPDAPKWWGA